MSDTVTVPLLKTAWTNMTNGAGVGVISNSTDHDILYREASAQPATSESDGITLEPGEKLRYTLEDGQDFWGLGKVENGRVTNTPGDSHAQVALSKGESKVLQGLLFMLSSAFSMIDTVGTTHDFLLVVPAGTTPHYRHIEVASDGGPCGVDFYEGAAYSAIGTVMPVFNLNRNSSNTPAVAWYDSPTITNTGTLLEPVLINGTKQQGSLASETSPEWVLLPSTVYLVRVTNNTGGATTSNFTLNTFWYE